MVNKFEAVLCHKFNPQLHGFDKNSDPNVLGHYLCIQRFKKPLLNLNVICSTYFHIASVQYLRGGECICILKTWWISLIQRCFRRAFASRKAMLTLHHFKMRELGFISSGIKPLLRGLLFHIQFIKQCNHDTSYN